MDTTLVVPVLASPTASHPGPGSSDSWDKRELFADHQGECPDESTWPPHPDTTVLLTMSHPRIREELHLTLRGRGYIVLEASCAREAVNICERHIGPIDVMVAEPEILLGDRLNELRPAMTTVLLCFDSETVHHAPHVLRYPFGLKHFLSEVGQACIGVASIS